MNCPARVFERLSNLLLELHKPGLHCLNLLGHCLLSSHNSWLSSENSVARPGQSSEHFHDRHLPPTLQPRGGGKRGGGDMVRSVTAIVHGPSINWCDKAQKHDPKQLEKERASSVYNPSWREPGRELEASSLATGTRDIRRWIQV